MYDHNRPREPTNRCARCARDHDNDHCEPCARDCLAGLGLTHFLNTQDVPLPHKPGGLDYEI